VQVAAVALQLIEYYDRVKSGNDNRYDWRNLLRGGIAILRARAAKSPLAPLSGAHWVPHCQIWQCGHTHRAPSFLAVLQVEREDLRMSYLGSKGGSGVYQKIIAEMPPHDTYIETHLGSGAVMFHKPLAARTIGIDVDENAFKLTRNRWSEMGRFRPCCIFITVMLWISGTRRLYSAWACAGLFRSALSARNAHQSRPLPS
jgi:hypothetical protein